MKIVRALSPKSFIVMTFVIFLAVLGYNDAPLTLAFILAMAAVFFFFVHPQTILPVALFLAYAAVPETVPRGIQIHGMNVFFYEIALMLAMLYSIRWRPRCPRSDSAALVILLVALAAGAFGILVGNGIRPTFADGRGILTLGVAVLVAGRNIDVASRDSVTKMLKFTLWFSATMIVLAQFGLRLHGLTEDAALALDGGEVLSTGGAVRLLTPATHLSLAVLCFIAALAVSGGISRHQALVWITPSLVIVFSSYSRNSLVALVAALLFCVVFGRSAITTVRLFKGLLGAGILGLVGYAMLRIFAPTRMLVWATVQSRAYFDRVISGLSPGTISSDVSSQYRIEENRLLFAAWLERPLFGHGLGFAFREAEGAPGSFTATSAVYYAHNFYLWLGVKFGLVGMAILLFVFLSPLFRNFRQSPPGEFGLACALAGMLAVSLVSPLPLGVESASSMLVGAMLGMLIAWENPAASEPTDGSTDPLRRGLHSEHGNELPNLGPHLR